MAREPCFVFRVKSNTTDWSMLRNVDGAMFPVRAIRAYHSDTFPEDCLRHHRWRVAGALLLQTAIRVALVNRNTSCRGSSD